MAYLTKTKRGAEQIFRYKPMFDGDIWYDYGSWHNIAVDDYGCDTGIKLPKGSIDKIVGRHVTFEECPVKI